MKAFETYEPGHIAAEDQTETVSVCITAYNIESYIRKGIESVLAQTYKNLEIIIVDDGSTDSSSVIIDEYAAEDDRIKAIHKENGGIFTARNACLDAVTGSYICWLDGDDSMDPEMIESMLAALKSTGSDMCVCRYRQVFADHVKDASTDSAYVYEGRQLLEQFLKEDERFLIQNAVWNKLYKAELSDGLRFPAMWYEDMVYTFYLLDRSKKSVYLDRAYYDYICDRASSQTNAGINPHTYTDLIPNLFDRSEYLESIGRHDLALISDYLLYKRLLIYYTKVSRSDDPDKQEHLRILDEHIRGGEDRFEEIFTCPIANPNEYRKMKIYLRSPAGYLRTMQINDRFIVPLKVKMAASLKCK
ncbi:MAG: glycosyltransferase family 2 protein [Lachnospiraceae bacterium]|nr:glycosyltransferase family 2 protein [Lachnospiraceae bacterium]